MKNIKFEDIYTLGEVVEDTDQYRHYHYPDMLTRYDSNFIEFKKLPSLKEFQRVEKYLREYHLKRNQQHVKFYFPDNLKLTDELTKYLNDSSYHIGLLELYAIQPSQFPTQKDNIDIDIQIVTEETLEVYLQLQYENNIEFGVEFAEQSSELIKRQYVNDKIIQILAFYKEVPAGYVNVIVSDNTFEIDNLYVLETFRNKGIGSKIQKFVMDLFPEKTIILLADGEDTAREMYKKQNYEYLGFKYEVQKVY